ncbi:MAG: PAS domain-containing hybrid sensor histidine kinase/response regulator, partial [Proteobacteria bacterium]
MVKLPLKQSRLHMKDIKELCQRFGDNSPLPMMALEAQTLAILYANPAVCEELGVIADNLLQKTFRELPQIHSSIDLDSVLKRLLNEGIPESVVDMQCGTDASRYWSYTFWTMKVDESAATRIVVQMVDVTESVKFRRRSVEANQSLLESALKQHELTEEAERLNEELEAASQAKNQFLAVMSHELRTPLNAIMGFSDLLSQSDQSQSDRAIFADRLQRNSQLLLRLIDDILDLSKIEAGKLDIETVECNLLELLSDIETIMKHSAQIKGIHLSLLFKNEMPQNIVSDPTRLKQVLTNIIGNAVKFTHNGSVKISIEADSIQHRLQILVEDTGRGISREDQAKLFQPFTQGNSTTTRNFGGTG